MKVPREDSRREWLPLLWGLAMVAVTVALWLWRIGFFERTDPEALWHTAEADFLAGRHDAAEAALTRLSKLRAPTTNDWLLRAQVDMVRNRNDEALDDLAKVPDSEGMAPQARLLAGQLELRRGRLRSAERLLLEATRLDPDLVQAHRELIYIYGVMLRRKELDGQFRELERLASQNKYTMTYSNVFQWCLTRNSVWEPQELISLANRFLEADPDDRWSRLALAENLRQVGQRDEADKALERLPDDDPEALAIRARIALDRGDDEAAEACLAKGPKDDAGLNRLRGKFALAHRDGAAALRFFQAAYQQEPGHRDALFGLGQAYKLVGDAKAAAPFEQAARDLDELGTLLQRAATDAGQKDLALLRSMGSICERIGRFPEARAWYSLVLQAEPLDAESQKALFRLRDKAPAPAPTLTSSS